MQQTEVEVGAQRRVGHLPLVAQHGVLVRAELRQHLLDEVPEATQSSGTVGRPRTVGWLAPHVRGMAVDVRQHLGVERTERIRRSRRPVTTVLRRRLAVLGVEVPPVPHRVVTVHQVAEPATLPPVEVLHPEGLAGVGPRREGVGGAQELLVRRHLHALGAKHHLAVEGHRRHGHDARGGEVPPVGFEAGGQRRGATMVHLEPCVGQFLRESTHRGQHEVETLSVPALRCQLGRALHEEDPHLARSSPAEGAHVTGELVAEHPDRVHDRTLRVRSLDPRSGEAISRADQTRPAAPRADAPRCASRSLQPPRR